MEKLIEIKAEKETYMNELEKLRLDVLKEKSVLESLKQHNITLLDNEIPQYLCKSKNDVSDLSQNLPPLVLQPASLQRQINLPCRSSLVEKPMKYLQEKVPPLSPSRPCPEPPAAYLYDYPRPGSLQDSLALYRQMLDNAGRLLKADERLQDKGLQQ